jgi:hypothetical protein
MLSKSTPLKKGCAFKSSIPLLHIESDVSDPILPDGSVYRSLVIKS